MTTGQKVTIWAAAIGAGGAIMAAVLNATLPNLWHKDAIRLQGAVMKADADPAKWFPIPGVQVGDKEGLIEKPDVTSSQGGFTLVLKSSARMGQSITLTLQKEGYRSAEIKEAVGDKLYTEYIAPVKIQARAFRNEVRFLRVADTYKEIVAFDLAYIPGIIRTEKFSINNRGNVPCRKGDTCSPDRRWKAAVKSLTLDAPPDRTLRDAQITCVAGPCPFTNASLSATNGTSITANAATWSDTATFSIEAIETKSPPPVLRMGPSKMNGQAFAFLAPDADLVVTAAAETSTGETIVEKVFTRDKVKFKSLATCTMDKVKFPGSATRAMLHSCSLNPGFRFAASLRTFPQFRAPDNP